jgi:hypothetical protein
MKKWIGIPLMMALLIPISSQGQPQEEVPPLAQQIAENIQQAVQSYKNDEVVKGATILCDVVLMTRPSSAWPEGFTEALDSAKDSFQKTNFSEGVASIKKAIKIFKPDYLTSSEESTGQLANIAQIILNKIESAVENFKVGNADQAVLLILESLTLLSP